MLIDDSKVRVEVQDNGIGIDQSRLTDIFSIFTRAHIKDEYEGIGLGLATCKRIVEKHCGEIGVSSTVCEGTVFWFTIAAANTNIK